MNEEPASRLEKYLSPLNVWALSFGCAVGWGAFVMPGTTFLPLAGPLGTAIGLFIGAIAMLIIGMNYCYLMKKFPDAGGAFTYTKNFFGYDHGFLNAWFLVLTYIAIVWANASALNVFVAKIFGNVLRGGFHYTFLGSEVYVGEVIASIVTLVGFASICMFGKRIASSIQTIVALILFIGVVVGSIAIFSSHSGGAASFEPLFLPNENKTLQILTIAALAPWAFVGFESISHATEGFKFDVSKAFTVVILSIISGFIVYTLLAEIAIASVPSEYGKWTHYVSEIGDLVGFKGLPTFYSIQQAMGSDGVTLFAFAALGSIITGILGNTIAASRLVYSMARDEILPRWLAGLSKDGTPRNAIIFICAVSIIIPFFGRAVINWTVDLLSINASIVYGYVSACAYMTARNENDLRRKIFGIIGVVLAVTFAFFLFVPNLLSITTMSIESYLILSIWGILGFVFFRGLFSRDVMRRFGRSVIVYVVMLFLIFFSSLMWMRQASNQSTERAILDLRDFYSLMLEVNGVHRSKFHKEVDDRHVEKSLNEVRSSIFMHSVVQMGLMILSLSIMFNIYSTMKAREDKADREREDAERHNEFLKRHARTDALTGLLNKATSEEELASVCQDSKGTLIIIDLDSFKLVNDLYGHAMGDEILIAFAQIIREVLEPDDVAGRLGGDEFVAFCYDVEDEMVIAKKAEEINKLIVAAAKGLMGDDMNIPLGASLGCVRTPKEGNDFSELFKKADKALYAVKQAGKHGYRFFTSDLENDSSESSLIAIELILGERNRQEDAMVLSMDNFRAVYRFLKRREARSSNCILLLTLSSPEAEEEFLGMLQSVLRRSDSITQSGKCQFVVLLCDLVYDDVESVVKRIQKNWKKNPMSSRVSFKCEWNLIK